MAAKSSVIVRISHVGGGFAGGANMARKTGRAQAGRGANLVQLLLQLVDRRALLGIELVLSQRGLDERLIIIEGAETIVAVAEKIQIGA